MALEKDQCKIQYYFIHLVRLYLNIKYPLDKAHVELIFNNKLIKHLRININLRLLIPNTWEALALL